MALVKYNNNSISAVTSTGLTAGAMTLIKSQTASSSATISFVHGTSDVVLDSTYPIYLFKFINCHPGTDNANFIFNGSIDAGSNYNVTKTTTLFRAYHYEDGSIGAGIGYRTSQDIAQGTGFQDLTDSIGNDNDSSMSGKLWLFSPSSATYVKHFMAETMSVYQDTLAWHGFIAGYFNNTNDIDAIQFKMDDGNIDAGTIKLYGIKDS